MTTGLNRVVIDYPDLSNDRENTFRATLLSGYRGYNKDELLFKGFPKNIRWSWAALDNKDLEKVKYGNFASWIDDSNGTRLARVAAERIRSGATRSSNAFVVLKACQSSSALEEAPVILVAQKSKDTLVIFEGHVRITSYLVMPITREVRCLVGFSEMMSNWQYF